MSSSIPANKPIFQTPIRTNARDSQQSSVRKTPPTSLNTNQLELSNKRQNEPTEGTDTARFRQVNIHINERTNQPYLQSRSIERQSPAFGHNSYQPSEYSSMRPNELLEIIELYEYQIAILKDYIHQSDLVDRHRIVQIFGFEYPCCSPSSSQQSKLVLKQLSIKIKSLIQENHSLKQDIKITSHSPKEDQMLLRENQRLRALVSQLKSQISSLQPKLKSNLGSAYDDSLAKENRKLKQLIQQFKNSESADINRGLMEIDSLRRQNSELNELARKYKIKCDVLEQQIAKSRKSNAPVISQIRPIREQVNASSSVEIQFAKRQVTKQLFQFEQEQREKNQAIETRIQQLQSRINSQEAKLKEYEKQRSLNIDSTLRKSFMLTQSILRLKGDVEHEDSQPLPQQEILTIKKQEGKIRTTNKFVHKKENSTYDVKIQTDVEEKRLLQTLVESSNKNLELKQAQESVLMEQMKNKNLQQENNMLLKKLTESQAEAQQRIDRNIKLEKLLMDMEKDKQKQKTVIQQVNRDEASEQVKQVIELLKSCNIANFQLFFQEFNQILAQRKVYRDTIEQYRSVHQAINRSKASRNAEQERMLQNVLEQKISLLIDENKKLIKRVSELEGEVQQYHEDMIKNQIQKLNSIKFNEPIQPTGAEAIKWQRELRGNIESALIRLYNLQRKVKEGDGGKKMVRQQIESSKRLEVSQSKIRQPKQP